MAPFADLSRPVRTLSCVASAAVLGSVRLALMLALVLLAWLPVAALTGCGCARGAYIGHTGEYERPLSAAARRGVSRLVRWLARSVLFLVGVYRLRVERRVGAAGTRADGLVPRFIVANHVSYLDPVVIVAVFGGARCAAAAAAAAGAARARACRA